MALLSVYVVGVYVAFLSVYVALLSAQWLF